MKKLLLSLAIILATILPGRADVVAIVAQGASYTGDGVPTEFNSGNGSIDGVCSFSLSTYHSGSKHFRIYANSNLVITPADDVTITRVTFTNVNSTKPTITLNNNSEGEISTTDKVTTWTGSTTKAISITGTAQIRVNYIEVTYTVNASTKEDVTLKWAESDVTVNKDEVFTLPELTVTPEEASSAVVYTSSNEAIASIIDGKVVVSTATPGIATITASISDNETYKNASAELTITVVDPNATEATFDFTKARAYGLTPQTGNTYETAVSSIEETPVTISFTGNFRQWTLTNGYELRMHKGSSMTFTVPDTYYITSIEFTGDALTKFTTDASAPYSYSTTNHTVTCSGTDVREVTLRDPSGTGDTQKINTITVHYGLDTTGIADIEAEENGVVEYFNLQGVRVAEPANGLYIRRAGNKVEKVIVR